MRDLIACRLRREVQEIGEAGRDEEDEGYCRQKQIEGDAAGEEENVILGAVIPNAPGVVTERPPETLEDSSLPTAPGPRAAVRYSSVVDPLLELPEAW
jgi:hypothetical protein